MGYAEPVARIVERIEILGAYSEHPDYLDRPFLSPSARSVNNLISTWMAQAGLSVREDDMGNVIGTLPATQADAPYIVSGSHVDTVICAGKYDGVLGFLMSLAVAEILHAEGGERAFHFEVPAFSDEEGVRFQTAYLGSSHYIGAFNPEWLDRLDRNDISLREALQTWGSSPEKLEQAAAPEPRNILGYIEVHIEQGPLLEEADKAVGVVSAICGQTRAAIDFTGKAGHAGNTPMSLRRDALAAAAEFVLETERLAQSIDGLRATVGCLHVDPNASNVIPGHTALSLDLRHIDDAVRENAIQQLKEFVQTMAATRQLKWSWEVSMEKAAVPCDPSLSNLLTETAAAVQNTVPLIESGAGHDAVMMAQVMPITMLLIRCKDGLSHHPDEYVNPEDIHVALQVMVSFVKQLADHHA